MLGRWLFLLLVAAAALALLTGTDPVYADGPRVIRNQQEIDFPQEVAFTLEVQAERDIVEVRLNYRFAGSRVWAYSYPTFSPGKRIVAQFSVPTDGANYLSPGSRIEFSYLIIDSQGNEQATSPQILEYTDTRYQWEETKVGPLTLFHHDVSQKRVDSLALELAPEIERVATLLQLNPKEVAPIKGYIYNSSRETQDAFPNQSRTITTEQVFHGFAFPENRVFIGIGLEPGLIVHETTHLLFAQALEPRSRFIPSWLDEGFASYMEPGSRPFSGRSMSQYGVSLRAMSTVSGTPRDIYTFYFKAESVVAYLIQAHGEPDFQEFMDRLVRGSSFETALLQVYGFNIDELELQWSRSSTGRSAQAPSGGIPTERPNPILYLNSMILGALVLLVAIFATGRFFWRRLHTEENPEEGLQPWEDPDRDPDNPW
ncbi:MAG: peptidase MA family metallohydrolase [Dehalococcoidia bacterium]